MEASTRSRRPRRRTNASAPPPPPGIAAFCLSSARRTRWRRRAHATTTTTTSSSLQLPGEGTKPNPSICSIEHFFLSIFSALESWWGVEEGRGNYSGGASSPSRARREKGQIQCISKSVFLYSRKEKCAVGFFSSSAAARDSRNLERKGNEFTKPYPILI